MLKTREDLTSLRQALEGRVAAPGENVVVCAGPGCGGGGARDI